jgi:hypothetical protein
MDLNGSILFFKNPTLFILHIELSCCFVKFSESFSFKLLKLFQIPDKIKRYFFREDVYSLLFSCKAPDWWSNSVVE